MMERPDFEYYRTVAKMQQPDSETLANELINLIYEAEEYIGFLGAIIDAQEKLSR